jgi:hypothetical protein
MAKQSKRKLTFRGETWTYVVGKSVVRFTRPDGRSFPVDAHLVAGRPPSVLERGRWKQTQDGMITPGDIHRFLDTLIVNYKTVSK